MRYGICTTVENSGVVKAAGWDFVEERIDQLLGGLLPDAEWKGLQRTAGAQLPILAANVLVPPSLKITGPDADLGRLEAYMRRVLARAQQVGIKTLVFGSGGARNVPDGWDHARARTQILDFLKMIAPLAKQHGVVLVVEHLSGKECNIIRSVNEAMTYVKEVNHPNIRCLIDSYHFWLNDEPLSSIAPNVPWIAHVHVADKDGRVAPGLSGTADYRPFFAELKRGGYDGPVSVEAMGFEIGKDGKSVLAFLKKQWSEA